MSVRALSNRNDELHAEVHGYKERLIREEDSFLSERNMLLAETDKLLAETDRMDSDRRWVMQQRKELRIEAGRMQASLDECAVWHAECEELRMEHGEAKRLNAVLEAEECVAQHRATSGACEAERMASDVEILRRENAALTAELDERRLACMRVDGLERELDRLREENMGLRQAHTDSERLLEHERDLAQENQRLVAQLAQASDVATPSCSEGRLRAILTNNLSSSDELRQAIGAADALIDEARRELAGKALREKRAAFEQLYNAIERGDEALLAEAIAVSRHAGIDDEDVKKGEAKLSALQSLSDEQRTAKTARDLDAKRKKEAYLLVKKNDASGLQVYLEGFREENVRWQDWRDYAGRTLWNCAQELRAADVQRLLAPLLGLPSPSEELKPRPFPWPSGRSTPLSTPLASADVVSFGEGDSPHSSSSSPNLRTRAQTDESPNTMYIDAPASFVETVDVESPITPSLAPLPLTPEEEDKLKARAFRAVVQDDVVTLAEVLEAAVVDVWSNWQNKAGKDLLTLSQERGSSCAYGQIAKALGMLQELKRESFEEREAVWVFVPGDVQPLRATVLEDTPEEADSILLEYWDGDAPAEHVERCLVRKMGS